MRRRQFLQLVSDLRAELRRSSEPAIGVSDTASLRQTISRVYETLYDEKEWPHLHVIFDRMALGVGQRYYDPPDGLDFDKITGVRLWWNSKPQKIDRGITLDDYGVFSSEDDQRSDPACKWDVRFVGTREQIEIWPLPATTGASLQFSGKKKFVPLTNDDDLCLIDDKLVLLYAAIELLPLKSADRELKLSAAQARLASLMRNASHGTERIRMGLGREPQGGSNRLTLRVSG